MYRAANSWNWWERALLLWLLVLTSLSLSRSFAPLALGSFDIGLAVLTNGREKATLGVRFLHSREGYANLGRTCTIDPRLNSGLLERFSAYFSELIKWRRWLIDAFGTAYHSMLENGVSSWYTDLVFSILGRYATFTIYVQGHEQP